MKYNVVNFAANEYNYTVIYAGQMLVGYVAKHFETSVTYFGMGTYPLIKFDKNATFATIEAVNNLPIDNEIITMPGGLEYSVMSGAITTESLVFTLDAGFGNLADVVKQTHGSVGTYTTDVSMMRHFRQLVRQAGKIGVNPSNVFLRTVAEMQEDTLTVC